MREGRSELAQIMPSEEEEDEVSGRLLDVDIIVIRILRPSSPFKGERGGRFKGERGGPFKGERGGLLKST